MCVCDKTHTYYIQKPAISFRFILTTNFVLKWKVNIIQYCFAFSPSTDSSASKYGVGFRCCCLMLPLLYFSLVLVYALACKAFLCRALAFSLLHGLRSYVEGKYGTILLVPKHKKIKKIYSPLYI